MYYLSVNSCVIPSILTFWFYKYNTMPKLKKGTLSLRDFIVICHKIVTIIFKLKELRGITPWLAGILKFCNIHTKPKDVKAKRWEAHISTLLHW